MFVPQRLAEFHAVLFGIALELPVPKHGQTGHGGHEHADAEVLVALAELIDGGALVGVVHEVDVALEDFGFKLEGVFDQGAVLVVFFVAQHVHEGAVVDAVHAQGAHKVAFHQPEGFGQQEGVGGFAGHAVYHLAPEFHGEGRFEIGAGNAMFGAGRDGPAAARLGEPQALVVLLGQGHGGVEADDGEAPGYVQDGLDDRFAHGGVEVVELGGVVPGHGGAVVAVVDVAGLPVAVILVLENHGSVAARRSSDLRCEC